MSMFVQLDKDPTLYITNYQTVGSTRHLCYLDQNYSFPCKYSYWSQHSANFWLLSTVMDKHGTALCCNLYNFCVISQNFTVWLICVEVSAPSLIKTRIFSSFLFLHIFFFQMSL